MDIASGIMLGILGGFGIYDLLYKKIPIRAVVVFGVSVLGYRVYAGAGIGELLAGLVPGAMLLLTSFCTKESIGYGDGMVLCVLGIFLGIRRSLAVFGMALVFAALSAIILLALKKAGRKTELPFLPCLFAGYLLSLVW